MDVRAFPGFRFSAAFSPFLGRGGAFTMSPAMPDTPPKVTIRLRVISDPFLGDPEGAEAFYAAAGRIIMLWGRFENHLDHALLSIVKLPEGGIIRATTKEAVPASFRRKADLWRQAFRACTITGS